MLSVINKKEFICRWDMLTAKLCKVHVSERVCIYPQDSGRICGGDNQAVWPASQNQSPEGSIQEMVHKHWCGSHPCKVWNDPCIPELYLVCWQDIFFFTMGAYGSMYDFTLCKCYVIQLLILFWFNLPTTGILITQGPYSQKNLLVGTLALMPKQEFWLG